LHLIVTEVRFCIEESSADNVSQVAQTDKLLEDILKVLLHPAYSSNPEDGLYCTIEWLRYPVAIGNTIDAAMARISALAFHTV
jgi:hypothetical protein